MDLKFLDDRHTMYTQINNGGEVSGWSTYNVHTDK